MKLNVLILTVLFFLIKASYAAELETQHYIVTITNNCQEGEVTCDRVIYNGKNKKTNKSITLYGTTWHTKGKNNTPGRFLGYKFTNGNITYYVEENGKLSVIRNKNEVLLEEVGKWKY